MHFCLEYSPLPSRLWTHWGHVVVRLWCRCGIEGFWDAQGTLRTFSGRRTSLRGPSGHCGAWYLWVSQDETLSGRSTLLGQMDVSLRVKLDHVALNLKWTSAIKENQQIICE